MAKKGAAADDDDDLEVDEVSAAVAAMEVAGEDATGPKKAGGKKSKKKKRKDAEDDEDLVSLCRFILYNSPLSIQKHTQVSTVQVEPSELLFVKYLSYVPQTDVAVLLPSC